MLLKKDLLEKIDEQYRPMFKDVSIPDFTKCIAQFSGLHISEVADSAIEEYLIKWAKNKYRFYKLLRDKLRYDTKIKYEESIEDKNKNTEKFNELAKEYPAYCLWLYAFNQLPVNKIQNYYLSYNTIDKMEKVFNYRSFEGVSLTHFFKSYISAPDELVTKIGKIFENQEIEANYTISIDPVDMMLASENPYNWTSCYRLEDGCHGDGPLAAMLDDSSLITYIWTKEGDFSLYKNYDFKHLRYKKMREYISISPSMNSIHFNAIYPGKSYPNEFEKTLRKVVEDLINKDAIWAKNSSLARRSSLDWYTEHSVCEREFFYGYGEFDEDNIYIVKGSNKDIWSVYNEQIICPCGCGNYLPESDADDENIVHDSEGFTYENYRQTHYCSIIDDYCDSYDGDCSGCASYNRENAKCELDEEHYCEGDTWIAEEQEIFNPYDDNVVHCSKEFCNSCPFYALHHQKDIDAENDEKKVAEGADQED